MDEAAYRRAAAKKGYGDPAEKTLAPGVVNDNHIHDVSLFVYVLEGEFTVDVETDGKFKTNTCLPGDVIEVPGGVAHIERIGPDGTKLLVARK